MIPSGLLVWILSLGLAFNSNNNSERPTSSQRGASSVAPTTRSPWSAAEWRVQLQIGRPSSDSTDTQAAWGASGIQLVLPIQIRIESERYTKDDSEKDFMGGSGACDRLTVTENAVYIPDVETGQQTVRFAPMGAWKLSTRQVAASEFSSSHKGQGGVVRFWLDVLDAVAKRDVSLAPHTRLYCTTKCWRQSDFTIGTQRMQPLHRQWQALSNEIEARLQHDTGDRRLDGTNLWDTALASLDMARLIQDRDEAWRQLQRASEQGLFPVPPGARMGRHALYSPPGPWPGTTEDLILARGAIVIQESKGAFGMFKEYRTVGTWTATPVLPLPNDSAQTPRAGL